MRKRKLPDSREKRKLLFNPKTPKERLVAFGEAFLEAGRFTEAYEFFRKASHDEGLDALKALAVEQGDSFLYGLVAKATGDGENREAWTRLGRKAMELKKFSHAVRAFRNADETELLKQAEEALREVFSIDQA